MNDTHELAEQVLRAMSRPFLGAIVECHRCAERRGVDSVPLDIIKRVARRFDVSARALRYAFGWAEAVGYSRVYARVDSGTPVEVHLEDGDVEAVLAWAHWRIVLGGNVPAYAQVRIRVPDEYRNRINAEQYRRETNLILEGQYHVQ